MKDKSIFKGIKELGELRFTDRGSVWDVGVLYGNYYAYHITIRKNKRESNKALYARAKEIFSDLDILQVTL